MMDEQKESQKTVEVVDTADQPAEGGPMVKETVAENKARMNPENKNEEELAPLFDMEAAEKIPRSLAVYSK